MKRGELIRSSRGRLLVVTSNFPRWHGDSTTPFVLHLCEDLAALGWEVDVLAPHAPGAALDEAFGRLRIFRFRYAWPEEAQTVCYQGGALVNLRKRATEKWKLPLLVAAELLAVQGRLLSEAYDVVHSHWMLPQGFVGALATRVVRTPHVITVHGGDLFALRGRTLEGFKRFALTRADAVTVNSSYTERGVRVLAPTLRDVRRIPMGVQGASLGSEEVEHRDRLRARFGSGARVAVFVGRLVEEKGIFDFIEALSILNQSGVDVRGLVVGEGQERARVESLIREWGLESRVEAVGWVAPNRVRATMAACDVFVGPSKTASDGWVEAQGLTFLEAMTVGLPVVATRSGGIVDAVRDGETGWLVSEGSPTELAAAIRAVFDDPVEAARRASRARTVVEERFSRASSVAEFDRLFRSLGAESSSRR